MQIDPLLPSTRVAGRSFGHVIERDRLGSLAAAGVERLRALVDDHGVVCVRGFGCDPAELEGVARGFGELRIHPVQELTGQNTTISTITDDVMRPPAGFPWHTDLSWLSDPPHYGFLQAIEIPNFGGDTMWADLVSIHSALSENQRNVLERSHGVHSIDDSLLATIRSHRGVDVADELRRRHPPVQHPIVGTHTASGAPLLAVCPMYLRSIAELDGDESAPLLTALNALLDEQRHTLRWSWTIGDLVVWDETSTNHKALADHTPRRRVMRRCVAGHSGDRA